MLERMMLIQVKIDRHWHELTQLIVNGLVSETEPDALAAFRERDREILPQLSSLEKEIRNVSDLPPLRRLQVSNVVTSYWHVRDSSIAIVQHLEAGDAEAAAKIYTMSAVPLYASTLGAIETFRNAAAGANGQ